MNPNPLKALVAQKKAETLDPAAITGFTEDEVLEWAISHNVELDIAEGPAPYPHMIDTVVSAQLVGDRVAIVLGLDPDPQPVAAAINVDAQLGLLTLEEIPGEDEVDDVTDANAGVDDYFVGVAAQNETIADGSWLQTIAENQPTDEAPVEDTPPSEDFDDPPTLVAAAPPEKRDKRKFVLIAIGTSVALSLLMILLGSSTPAQKPPTAQVKRAAPVTAAVSTPAVKAARSAKKPVAHRRHKKSSRPKRRAKRHSASAPSTTPQAAPRPVAPQSNYSAPSSGGRCGSRSSEFSFEC